MPDTHDRLAVPTPTPATRFWRTFLPWQLVRFVSINLKMLQMIARSHPHRIDR